MRMGRALLVCFLVGACESATSPPVDSGASTIGAPCTSDADCDGPMAACITTSSQWGYFPGGYCTRILCGDWGDACTPDSTCQAHPGHGPQCFRNCTSDADCRASEGYSCQPHPLVDSTYCLPTPDAG